MSQFCSRLLVSSFLSLLIGTQAFAAVSVVTTIQPLALIARAVAGDSVNARVLVDSQDSAHHVTLSPGERLAVENADLIVWVGPQFEVFLETLMSRLDAQALITATDLPGMTLHRLDARTIDPHVWLDPANAGVIATAIATELSRLNPQDQAVYAANLERFNDRLASLRSRITGEMAALPLFDFAVYHNAYQYFEQRFGLRHGVALVDNPEVAPGIQQTLQVQARIRELQPACVLLEPDYSPALLATLMRDSTAEQIHVDLLGYELTTDSAASNAAEAYEQLIGNIADNFSRCAEAARR